MIRDGQTSYPHPVINTSPAPITTCHGSHGHHPGIRAGAGGGVWKGGTGM